MTAPHRTRLARFALATLACALLLLALPGCGAVGRMMGVRPPQETAGSSGSASSTSPAKKIDYASLLSAADVARITGVSAVATMEPGERAGDSPYYVLFTSPTTPEFLSFRVAKPEWYDEELKLLKGTETKLDINGAKEAYSYASKDMAESGIVIRMPDTSNYVVVTRWLFKTPEGKPQLADDQLKQVAELVVKRSQ
jgi:hypothetical protein